MYHNGRIKKYKRKRKDNIIVEKEQWMEIHYETGEIALFDKEDLEFVKQCYWGIDLHGYLHGRIEGRLARFHRHLLGFPNGTVDHINRDKLDNRKSNLRIGTQRDNSRNRSIAVDNTSGVTGVWKDKNAITNKWVAEIMVNRKKISLGRYETLEEAAKIRRKAEEKYFDEYAPIHD